MVDGTSLAAIRIPQEASRTSWVKVHHSSCSRNKVELANVTLEYSVKANNRFLSPHVCPRCQCPYRLLGTHGDLATWQLGIVKQLPYSDGSLPKPLAGLSIADTLRSQSVPAKVPDVAAFPLIKAVAQRRNSPPGIWPPSSGFSIIVVD